MCSFKVACIFCIKHLHFLLCNFYILCTISLTPLTFINSRGVGVDQWKSHLWCRRLWSFCAMRYSTLLLLIDLEFIFNILQKILLQYTHYVRHERYYWRHFNVNHICSRQAMHLISSLHFLIFSIIFNQVVF